MRLLDLRGIAPGAWDLPAPAAPADEPTVVAAVREILADVRSRGDDAVRELTRRLDGVDLADHRVPPAEVAAAPGRIPTGLRTALEAAADRIADYHGHQRERTAPWERDGIRVEPLVVPVDRAGCYVPGGRAVYPSTVLMTAVIARVAGVAEVVLCCPPGPDGEVPLQTLAAAAIAGVTEVHRIGGAQAIAAMAYGTATVRPVDVIVGPGNRWVAVAKREVAAEGAVGVPSAFTGPSEVVVIADGTVDPAWAAIDLIVQAEHGPDGLAWLVTWDPGVLDAVTGAVSALAAAEPRSADIGATLAANGWAVLVDGPAEAVEVANRVAPEHLELMVADPSPLVRRVRHAGAVFCGPWSPAALGDYVAGPSHVLPTSRSARFGEALSVRDFQRHIHVVTATPEGLSAHADHVTAIAAAEGLDAHARAITLRFDRREPPPAGSPGGDGR